MKGAARLAIALMSGLWLITAGAAPLSVTDATGQRVTLEQPARRIVSLSPHITEQLFAIGAGGFIVGTVEWSDYPEAAKAIPLVGSSSAINYEVLVRLDPDLVLVWRSGNGEQVVARLRALGLAVHVQEPERLEDIPLELARLGVLAGREQQAGAVIENFNARIAALRDRYEERRPVRVFQQIWNQPMITLNGDHLVSDIIRLCGGRNIFADAPTLVVSTSLEAVLLRDPELIVVSEADGEPPPWIGDWQKWPGISAVANGQVRVIDPDLLHRHGPRIAEGAEQLCQAVEQARQALTGQGNRVKKEWLRSNLAQSEAVARHNVFRDRQRQG